MRPHLVFITGTDTDVGKTHAAARLARAAVYCGLRVGVYKPVASGCRPQDDGTRRADDAVQLWEAAGRPLTIDQVCPQKFLAAVAPNTAAAMEAGAVDDRLLTEALTPWTTTQFDLVIVEGAGGLFSPLSNQSLNIDLIERISPDRIVVVAANRLGVIHQTLCTLTAAAQRKIAIDEVWLNQVDATADVSAGTNAAELTRILSSPAFEQSFTRSANLKEVATAQVAAPEAIVEFCHRTEPQDHHRDESILPKVGSKTGSTINPARESETQIDPAVAVVLRWGIVGVTATTAPSKKRCPVPFPS